jgi:hypothetical protein
MVALTLKRLVALPDLPDLAVSYEIGAAHMKVLLHAFSQIGKKDVSLYKGHGRSPLTNRI